MVNRISRRPPPPVGDLGQAQWNAARSPLNRWLKWAVDNFSGIPGGFKSRTPEVVTVGGTGLPGSMQDGWMSASAQLVTETGTPSGLGNASAEGTSSAAPRLDHVHKRDVRVKKAGADVGTRNALNFIEGTGVTITVADNGGSDRVDVTINASGGGGGMDPADLEYLSWVL